MKLHRAVLDIAGRLVHIDSPMYGKVIFHLPTVSRIKVSLHHMVELKLEDIHVVREFSDMFPDDLPGMPPERAIEFKIELQPSTAPLAKAAYKMSPMEMKELEESTARFAGQRIYPPMYITLGLFSVICREERQRVAFMYGLSTAQCSHHQEQVPTPMH
jgi:hypothetical protein